MQSLQVADPLMMVLAFVKILAWALRVFSTPDPSTCFGIHFPRLDLALDMDINI